MSENLWLTNTAADAIGGGDTQKLLSDTAGVSGVAITVTTGGRVWNYQETTSGGRTITGGTWTLDLPAFSTKANDYVTCTVKIYTAAGALYSTLWSATQKIRKSTYAYHEFTSTIGDVTIPENYYLVVFLQKTSGTGTVNMRYNEDVNLFDTKLVTPNTVVSYGSTTTYDVASHLLPAHCLPLTPIAMLYQPPHWRVSSAFDLGVVAFCAATDGTVDNRIASAKFTVAPDAGSYTGTSPDTVTTWSTNSGTGIYDLNKSIDPADFTADCTADITILVTGDEGGTRTLTTSYKIDTGTLSQTTAYVDKVSGDDGTGVVDDSGNPYATIHAAVVDCYTANSNSCDGVVIYLKPGQSHVWDHLNDTTLYTNSDEWLTVTSWGGDSTDTNLDGAPTYYASKVPLIRLYDIEVGPTLSTYLSEETPGNKLLVENCYINPASGQTIGNSVTARDLAEKMYYYNTEFDGSRDAIKARGILQDLTADENGTVDVALCNIHDITRDAITTMRSGAIVGNTITTIDRGIPAYHADLFQFTENSSVDNVVIYANTCTDIDAQLLLLKRDTDFYKFSNFAFVNNYIQIPTTADFQPFWMMQGDLHHFIVWNNTFDFRGTSAPAGSDVYQFIGCRGSLTQPRDHVGHNISLMGSNYTQFRVFSDDYEWVGAEKGMYFLWDDSTNIKHNNNWYTVTGADQGEQLGTNWTNQNPQLGTSGNPPFGGVLTERMAPLVGVDLAGTTRPNPGAIGAYEPDPRFQSVDPTGLTFTMPTASAGLTISAAADPCVFTLAIPTVSTSLVYSTTPAPAVFAFSVPTTWRTGVSVYPEPMVFNMLVTYETVKPIQVQAPVMSVAFTVHPGFYQGEGFTFTAVPMVVTLGGVGPTPSKWTQTGHIFDYEHNSRLCRATRFELMIRAENGTAYARLVDADTGIAVAGTQVSTTDTAYTRQRSPAVALVNGSSYQLEMGETIDAGAEAYGAKLIFT